MFKPTSCLRLGAVVPLLFISQRAVSVFFLAYKGGSINYRRKVFYDWFYKLALLDFELIFEDKMQESEGV